VRFTHERSWNEDCILHVCIPFFNWMTVFLQTDWKITIFFDERNWFFESSRIASEIVYMAHSEEVLINYFWQGCHSLSGIFTSTRKWLSRRVDWIVSDDFMNSSFWHSRVPWNIWQPQSNIEKVNNFVPCIRRQRFVLVPVALDGKGVPGS